MLFVVFRKSKLPKKIIFLDTMHLNWFQSCNLILCSLGNLLISLFPFFKEKKKPYWVIFIAHTQHRGFDHYACNACLHISK